MKLTKIGYQKRDKWMECALDHRCAPDVEYQDLSNFLIVADRRITPSLKVKPKKHCV